MEAESVLNIVVDVLHPTQISNWEDFLTLNEASFENFSFTAEIEHFQFEIYTKFTQLVEDSIESCCLKHSISSEQFKDYFRENQSESIVQIFGQVLLMATSFEVFGDICSSTEKRKYMFQILSSWRNQVVSRHK